MKLVAPTAKVLRAKAEPVVFSHEGGKSSWTRKEIGHLVMLMLDFMYLKQGIGLAAPQVGISRRVIVVDPVGKRYQARVMINPEIWFRSEETELGPEGCLLIPKKWGMVRRARRVKVTYYNEDGLRQEFDSEEDTLLARIIQHEVDHLEGVLFIDKLEEP